MKKVAVGFIFIFSVFSISLLSAQERKDNNELRGNKIECCCKKCFCEECLCETDCSECKECGRYEWCKTCADCVEGEYCCDYHRAYYSRNSRRDGDYRRDYNRNNNERYYHRDREHYRRGGCCGRGC